MSLISAIGRFILLLLFPALNTKCSMPVESHVFNCTHSCRFRLSLVEKENHTTLRLHKGLRIAVLYFWKTFNYSLQSKAFLMETKWPPIAKIFFLLWQALRWVMIWRYYIPASNNLLHSSVSHCTVVVSDVLLWFAAETEV